jgi:hypothetical protein
MKMAPVKGPFYLVVVAVTALDDDGLAATMMPAPVHAMVAMHPHFSAGAVVLLLDDRGLCACRGHERKGGKSGDNES